MSPWRESALRLTRRQLLSQAAGGLGAAALATLVGDSTLCAGDATGVPSAMSRRGLPGLPHGIPSVKRVIYLFQSGGPSQIDLFDYKPKLTAGNKRLYVLLVLTDC